MKPSPPRSSRCQFLAADPVPSSAESRFFRMLLGGYLRPIKPAPMRPDPASWNPAELTVSWLGHSTVLLNFCGITILTDPALGKRVGLGWPVVLVGPKRHIAPALRFRGLPRIDLVLLSHAHMDHFDLPTLRRFSRETRIVTARRTADLLRHPATEMSWGQRETLSFAAGEVEIESVEVRHWGARVRTDNYRGYGGYILRRNGMAVLFAGDTAYTPLFRRLRGRGGADGQFDLAMFPIGAYDPWIGSHCTPEQAVAMADDAGARFILPIHHQTFQLSQEPMDEPIQRFARAVDDAPARSAAMPIGGTFRIPPPLAK